MLPKVIFFDLDDTLIDHKNASRSAFSKIRESNDVLIEFPLDDLLDLWRKDFQKYWELMIQNRITIYENWSTRFREVFRSLGHEIGEKELDSIVIQYRDNYISGTYAVAGAIDILKKARENEIHVSIITNNTAEMQYRKLDHCDMRKYIDSMNISQDYGIMKPDPRIFRIALEKSGFAPDECIMVGDSLESDVVGALGVGITPVWFNRNGYENTLTDHEVRVLKGYEPLEDAWNQMISAFSERTV